MRINAASPQARGLSAAWPLLTDSTNAVSGSLGTLNGPPKRRPFGMGFGATSGTGSTDYINTGKTDHATQRTYTCWLYWDGSSMFGTPGRIFDKRTSGSEVELLFMVDQGDGSAKVDFSRWWSGGQGSWATNNAPILKERWWCIAVSYDASSSSNDPAIYVNGRAVALVDELLTPSGSVNSNAESYIIGNRANDTLRAWRGFLVDLRFYDRILTPLDIWDIYVDRWGLYQSTPLMTDAGSVYWWTQPATPTSTQAPRSYDYFIHNW